MMTKEPSTKFVKCSTPKAAVLVPGHGHISHAVKMLNFIIQDRRGRG